MRYVIEKEDGQLWYGPGNRWLLPSSVADVERCSFPKLPGMFESLRLIEAAKSIGINIYELEEHLRNGANDLDKKPQVEEYQ